MLTINDSIKNAYNKYTTQRKSYIQVGNNSFFIENLDIQGDAYNEGNIIGNAISKIIKFDIETINVKNINKFELFDGIWTGERYEYISLGTFEIFDEQGVDDFYTSITAYDKLILFNKPYISEITYPSTIYNLLESVCSQAGVQLENTSIVNGEQILENELFVEQETLKTILKAICQISGTFAIISNDKLKLLLKGTENINLNNSQIANPEYKRTTWKINQVVLGMADVEGEYVLKQDDEDIAINGVHKLVINDNPFVFTQELRNQYIDNLFNQLKGFGYIAFECNWEGLSYVELGDLLNINGKESIVLRYNIKSPKGLESTLSAPSIIDSAVNYVNNKETIETRLKKTEILVNKASSQIDIIAQQSEEATEQVAQMRLETDNILLSVGSMEDVIFNSTIYEITKDNNFLEDKSYFYLDENGNYVYLEPSVDYQIGDEISTDVYEEDIIDGLEQRVSNNEMNISNQATTINIISTNIDTTTGDIQSVKTTTGYTLDKDGLKIEKSSEDYNTKIDNTGTYYKDGDTILGQTTKDGSIFKDMILYGKYYYGVDENLDVANFKKDDAMFVSEKYEDANGEVGFGHFYNGGD